MAPVAQRLAASGLRELRLWLVDCEAFTDEGARLLAAHLPETLVKLELEMLGSGVTAEGGRAVLDGVLRRLPLARLEELDLSFCELTGPIPEELGECKALKMLVLGDNQLTGPIPEALGKCEALEMLFLDAAQKEGIPEALRQRQQAGRLLPLRRRAAEISTTLNVLPDPVLHSE